MQLLKLGLIQGLPGLSEYFVIWDFDMLPARRIPLFYTDSPLLHKSAESKLRWDRLRTVVNIGGTRARGYGESFAALFGRPCAPLPTAFVCISNICCRSLFSSDGTGNGSTCTSGCGDGAAMFRHLRNLTTTAFCLGGVCGAVAVLCRGSLQL